MSSSKRKNSSEKESTSKKQKATDSLTPSSNRRRSLVIVDRKGDVIVVDDKEASNNSPQKEPTSPVSLPAQPETPRKNSVLKTPQKVSDGLPPLPTSHKKSHIESRKKFSVNCMRSLSNFVNDLNEGQLRYLVSMQRDCIGDSVATW
jgi:hypothetical protein